MSLEHFRRLRRYQGPQHPPVWMIHFHCPSCLVLHPGLLEQGQLDLAPLQEPAGSYYDLMRGRNEWAASELAERWSRSLRAGRWPLTLYCQHEARLIGGWPSVLEELEPDREIQPVRFLVHYRCPQCHQPGAEEWPAARLRLLPAG